MNKWVAVFVFQRKSKIIVSVFGYATEKEARAHIRQVKKELANNDVDPRIIVIAMRVRPIIEYIQALNVLRAVTHGA